MIRVGIVGYGNLGRGTECALKSAPDMRLCGVFTRRDPKDLHILTPDAPVRRMDELSSRKDEFDVLILCGGSATDLPEQTPELARNFNVVDSFDTHARIPEHFERVDTAARAGAHAAMISCGWDPGLFSLNRAYMEAVLPAGETYTFWGKGVSQGHSDAIRRIEGVADAKQYTVPVPDALAAVRAGETPIYSARQKHTRECFVVAIEGADRARIEREIKEMPNYFADYDTTVTFIDADTMRRDHSGIPHGGCVIRGGRTGWDGEFADVLEYNIRLESNPAFTSSVLVAYSRAVARMSAEGRTGCLTVFDIPPAYLSPYDGAELRKRLL